MWSTLHWILLYGKYCCSKISVSLTPVPSLFCQVYLQRKPLIYFCFICPLWPFHTHGNEQKNGQQDLKQERRGKAKVNRSVQNRNIRHWVREVTQFLSGPKFITWRLQLVFSVEVWAGICKWNISKSTRFFFPLLSLIYIL